MDKSRNEKIVVRLTDIEKDDIYRCAEDLGISVSEYVRQKCLASDTNIVKNKKSLEYVQLINAIDNIDDDIIRTEVSHRLEVLLCRL